MSRNDNSHSLVRLVLDDSSHGLKMLEAGGDFADSVIEYTGRILARNATTTFFSGAIKSGGQKTED
jgi:hypothetical protein